MVHDLGRGETPCDVFQPPTKRQRRESSRFNQVAAGVCETPARAGLNQQTRERVGRRMTMDTGTTSPTGEGHRDGRQGMDRVWR